MTIKISANEKIPENKIEQIYELFLLSKINDIISLFNDELYNFYSECSYIAPLRAEVNRYYRNQELQVNDIDSYGRNLQEFIPRYYITDNS